MWGSYFLPRSPDVDLLQRFLDLGQFRAIELDAGQPLAIVPVCCLDFLPHVLHGVSEVSSDHLSDGLLVSVPAEASKKRVDFLINRCDFLIDSVVLFGEVSSVTLNEFHCTSFAELKRVVNQVHQFPPQLLMLLLKLQHELTDAIPHKIFHSSLLLPQFFLHGKQQALTFRLGHLKVAAASLLSKLSVPRQCEVGN